VIRIVAVFVTFLLLAMPCEAATSLTAIKFRALWDGHRVIQNAIVVVSGDKVVSVTSKGPIPAGAKIIDLGHYTGIPGLIDAHTHMTYSWNPGLGDTPLKQRIPPSAVVFLAQDNARKTLEAGVTSVRDLGASGGI
jgi:imidazolonepropionase-like amidohydrolase